MIVTRYLPRAAGRSGAAAESAAAGGGDGRMVRVSAARPKAQIAARIRSSVLFMVPPRLFASRGHARRGRLVDLSRSREAALLNDPWTNPNFFLSSNVGVPKSTHFRRARRIPGVRTVHRRRHARRGASAGRGGGLGGSR